MTRSRIRELIFETLFIMEFHESDLFKDQLNELLSEHNVSEQEYKYIHNKAEQIYAKRDEIDEQVNSVSEKWKTTRMTKVDLTLIRLAFFEMKFDDDIPEKVAINEAVELAKKYGDDTSSSFVNGVLAKLV